MGIKKTATQIATLLLFFLVFKGFAADNDRDYLNGDGYQYRFISEEQVEVSQGKAITQILTYVGLNCNLDYLLTVFVNPKNEEISMNTGPDIEQNFSKGEKVKVTWELTTLHEAGAGDAPYYFWSIVEIEKMDN